MGPHFPFVQSRWNFEQNPFTTRESAEVFFEAQQITTGKTSCSTRQNRRFAFRLHRATSMQQWSCNIGPWIHCCYLRSVDVLCFGGSYFFSRSWVFLWISMVPSWIFLYRKICTRKESAGTLPKKMGLTRLCFSHGSVASLDHLNHLFWDAFSWGL